MSALKISAAVAILRILTEEERKEALRNFCKGCWEELAAGERCYCQNDE